jgi:hypothetical protein
MTSLHDILWNINNEDLAYRLKLLAIKPASPKKADLIDALKAAFAGNGLRAIWKSLDDLQQAAVAEACYAPGFAYDAARFRAKYGGLPSFNSSSKDGSSRSLYRSNAKDATRLNLLIYTSKDFSEQIVPGDLAAQLREFVPKPAELSVATLKAPVEEAGLLVRETEHESLADVMALLRLAEQGNLRISAKTGAVSAAGCRMILECLIGDDFYPLDVAYRADKRSYDQEIGAIKPIGWARLLQVGKYFSQTGSKSKLTAAGKRALKLTPEEVVKHLWSKWLVNNDYDEFNRIDDIKGQRIKRHMTAKPPRRDAIEDALIECPANEWIAVDKFSEFMQGAGHEFEVSHDLWKLYLSDREYGSFGYAGCGGWNIVQFRYILCLLFEYAATLGLIDIAYVHPRDGLCDYRSQWGVDELEWLSRYDGLRAIRITNLGAYCFGITSEYQASQPKSSLSLTVLPSLRIELLSGAVSPAEKLQLETWAEPVAANVWQLDVVRALEAVERGQSVADFTEFLQGCDDQPLPETVVGFLETSERNGKAVRSRGEATIFECRDAETTRLLCTQSELQGKCFRCGDNLVAVPDAHIAKFRKVVRLLELGIV